jgi:hypothetical protein
MRYLKTLFDRTIELLNGRLKALATYARIPEPVYNVKHYNIRDGFLGKLTADFH